MKTIIQNAVQSFVPKVQEVPKERILSEKPRESTKTRSFNSLFLQILEAEVEGETVGEDLLLLEELVTEDELDEELLASLQSTLQQMTLPKLLSDVDESSNKEQALEILSDIKSLEVLGEIEPETIDLVMNTDLDKDLKVAIDSLIKENEAEEIFIESSLPETRENELISEAVQQAKAIESELENSEFVTVQSETSDIFTSEKSQIIASEIEVNDVPIPKKTEDLVPLRQRRTQPKVSKDIETALATLKSLAKTEAETLETALLEDVDLVDEVNEKEDVSLIAKEIKADSKKDIARKEQKLEIAKAKATEKKVVVNKLPREKENQAAPRQGKPIWPQMRQSEVVQTRFTPPLQATRLETVELATENAPKLTEVLDLQDQTRIFPKLNEQIQALVQEDRSEVRIQLKPEHLGEMKIKLSMERGVMVAEFTVESQAVKEILASQLPQLQTALQDQGTNVADMMVNIGFGQSSKEGQDTPNERRTPNRRIETQANSSQVAVENQTRKSSNPWNRVDLKV